MNATEIRPGIYWVGAVDWAVRDFHGYTTPRGSTYNNYLIMDDDITLVDGVKHAFVDLCIKNIRSVTDPSGIRNIVINHIEPDHASGLGEIIKLAPKAAIYCTKKGKDGLERMFDTSGWKMNVVKTGDELKTGKRTLAFIETPMLHWPDSMMTCAKEDRLLFSQDAFGQHLASSERFDDEFAEHNPQSELTDAVWDYYSNILMPFGTLVKKKIEEVLELGLDIDMIAPDHGVIWRRNPGGIIQMYLDMAGGKAEERVLIVYDTMWQSTRKMAQPIMEGVRHEGMDVRIIKLRATPTSIAIKEFWRARGCLVGSPTLNNSLLPEVAGFLASLKGLRPKNRIVSAFGSYGWAGGAVKEILEGLKKMKLETIEPGLGAVSIPSPDDERKCFEFGREFARKTREYHKGFGDCPQL
jgi:flavorubredoxin